MDDIRLGQRFAVTQRSPPRPIRPVRLPAPSESRVPVYYIRRSYEGQLYTEYQTQKYMGDLLYEYTRIDAITGDDLEHAASFMGVDLTGTDGAKFKANAGVLAYTMSYLKAIAAAHEGLGNRRFALILEDDANYNSVPHWPKTILEMASELNELNPDWDVVRLSYTLDSEPYLLLQRWKSMYPSLPSVMAFVNSGRSAQVQNAEPDVLTGKLSGLLATLWSRRALSRFTADYVNLNSENVVSPGSAERYTYKLSVDCPMMEVVLENVELNQYIATPPYFMHRAATSPTKKTGEPMDEEEIHSSMASMLFASQFMSEAVETHLANPLLIPTYKQVPRDVSRRELDLLQLSV